MPPGCSSEQTRVVSTTTTDALRTVGCLYLSSASRLLVCLRTLAARGRNDVNYRSRADQSSECLRNDPIAILCRVLVPQGGVGAAVAHARHQLPCGRSRGRRPRIARVAQVV